MILTTGNCVFPWDLTICSVLDASCWRIWWFEFSWKKVENSCGPWFWISLMLLLLSMILVSDLRLHTVWGFLDDYLYEIFWKLRKVIPTFAELLLRRRFLSDKNNFKHQSTCYSNNPNTFGLYQIPGCIGSINWQKVDLLILRKYLTASPQTFRITITTYIVDNHMSKALGSLRRKFSKFWQSQYFSPPEGPSTWAINSIKTMTYQ